MSKTRVSLVLGSGGARGLAHIGAIRCLEERGYEIVSIAGSSMGALVGGVYAAGKLDVYAEWARALDRADMVRLLDFGWGRGGALFKGERLIATLRELVGERSIEELPMAYAAVATDLRRKREVWFDEGPLFSAIRASIAIPLVFTPVERGEELLLDGGILNPLPLARPSRVDADLVVAVDVHGVDEPAPEGEGPAPDADADEADAEPEDSLRQRVADYLEALLPAATSEPQEHGMLDIAVEAMDAMQVMIARQAVSAHAPDVLVQVPRSVARFFEFDRADELIALGMQRTGEALDAAQAASAGS